MIDFTAPAATAAHVVDAARLGKAMVVGTTGLSADQGEAVRQAAREIPIVWAPNMSLGINLLLGLVEEVARRLGPDWDVEIMEMHHRGKVDAPSGTALALGRASVVPRERSSVSQRNATPASEWLLIGADAQTPTSRSPVATGARKLRAHCASRGPVGDGYTA